MNSRFGPFKLLTLSQMVKWLGLGLVAFGGLSSSVAAQTTTTQIYEKNKRSVVLLLAYDSAGIPSAMGTGFFIEPTKIATNAHVVRLASRVVYRVLGSEKTLTAREIANFSERLDLAVLEASEPGAPVTLSAADNPQIGEKVVVIGNPRGLEGSVSEGIVAGVRGKDTSRLIQITAPISPGNSGGPVFNTQGEVIGIATATLRDAQNINFAVPVGLVGQLRSAGKSWEPLTHERGPEVRRATAGVEFVEMAETGHFQRTEYSIQNKNSYAIKNLRFLVVLRNKDSKNIVSYTSETVTNVVLPGLSVRKSSYIDGGQHYFHPEYISKHKYNWKPGELEFRVLTYDIDERAGSGLGADALLR